MAGDRREGMARPVGDDPSIGEAAAHLRSVVGEVPPVAIVAGSGLGALEERLEGTISVPFHDLAPLPAPGVSGHGGRFVAGALDGVPVLLQSGRVHAYEGHPAPVVVAPVRILAAAGVRELVLTNAAGAIHPLLQPGDIVLVDDQINLMFRSALAGAVRKGETRFPDMSRPFDPDLVRRLRRAADDLGMSLPRGTYAGVLGPSYETPAEVRMLQRLGADLVGMSTVLEVATARARGLPVAVLSLVTNRATGLGGEPLGHGEVLEEGRRAAERMGRLLARFVSDGSAAQSTGAK